MDILTQLWSFWFYTLKSIVVWFIVVHNRIRSGASHHVCSLDRSLPTNLKMNLLNKKLTLHIGINNFLYVPRFTNQSIHLSHNRGLLLLILSIPMTDSSFHSYFSTARSRSWALSLQSFRGNVYVMSRKQVQRIWGHESTALLGKSSKLSAHVTSQEMKPIIYSNF